MVAPPSPPLVYTRERGFCGDAKVDKDNGEECDDANIRDGDGCNVQCKKEDVFHCKGKDDVFFLVTKYLIFPWVEVFFHFSIFSAPSSFLPPSSLLPLLSSLLPPPSLLPPFLPPSLPFFVLLSTAVCHLWNEFCSAISDVCKIIKAKLSDKYRSYCRHIVGHPSLCYRHDGDGVCEDFEKMTSVQDCGFYTPEGLRDQWAVNVSVNPDYQSANCPETAVIGPPSRALVSTWPARSVAHRQNLIFRWPDCQIKENVKTETKTLTLIHFSLIFRFFKSSPFRRFLTYRFESWLNFWFCRRAFLCDKIHFFNQETFNLCWLAADILA